MQETIPDMTVTQAAKLTKLKARHLYSLVKAQQIPHFKLGGKIKFNREQLLAWLNEQNRRP
jgi:excisionase family DNA binding protein